jgi:cytochrome c-type biogenesis protein CcmH
MTVKPSMSERLRNIVVVGLLFAMAGALVLLVATNPTDADRVEAIGERIKCPVCQGESIANSPSQLARDMMAVVEQRVAEGESDQAIIDELLASYSGAVLLDPPASGWTLVLWLAPILALGGGVAVILWWRRHPGPGETETRPHTERATARRVAPLLILAGAFAAIVVVAGFFLQDRAGPNSGVADLSGQNLDEVSNETMEAVIDANADHPQVDGMRLALAERYYEEGNFRAAFPHYIAVAESPNAAEPQVVTALVRLGWMTWQGNAEAETAIDLLDQALAIDQDSATARYLKAQVLWCGQGDTEAASDLLEAVRTDPAVEEDVRRFVTADLEAIRSGETCA